MNAQAQLSTPQQLGSGGGAPIGLTNLESSDIAAEGDEEDDIPELEAPVEDDTVDETGVDSKDIDLVMAQVNCSRAKAVRALKESGGDLINASGSIFRMSVSAYLTVHCSHGRKRVILFSILSVSCAIHLLQVDSTFTSLSKLKPATGGPISCFPTPNFHVVIRSLPAVLYYLNTPSPFLWRPNNQAHFLRGFAGESSELSFRKHVIISVIYGSHGGCFRVSWRIRHGLFCGWVWCSALLGHHPRHEDIFSRG